MTLRLIWFFVLIVVIIGKLFADAQPTHCPKGDISFEKVLGLQPSHENESLLLYRGDNTTNTTVQCLQKCSSNDECKSFVLSYNLSTCYWFRNAIQGTRELENELDTDTAWFVKVCLKASGCGKLWVFERVPGATLVDNNTKTLPKTYTRTECQQSCLNEKTFACKSAKFKIIDGNYGPDDEVEGVCILSNSDRHAYPSSFRASAFADEYFENQCSPDDYDEGDRNEFCSYEEYNNVTLAHVDVYYENQTKDSCEALCEKTEKFHCRGFSLVSSENHFDCFLHSEDSKVHGPRLLLENPAGTYFEKAPCLNISIICTETYMTVRYAPKFRFLGRMYMDGYSERPECSVTGTGTDAVVLKLSVLSEQCGIIKAIAPNDRIIKVGTMILQFNPLVQTQGDRNIRIGCIYGNNSTVLVGTGITIVAAPNHASPLLNTTGSVAPPTVEMRVVDLNTHREVSNTQIGEELQLIIELKPADGSLDIRAGHLLAMTEHSEESLLLIDDRGCPTNTNIFPPLSKITTNSTKALVATFQAFKFSSSPIVRFSCVVTFCPRECPAIDCENGGRSYGRKKRGLQLRSVETVNSTRVINVSRDEFEKNPLRMPLEYVMIVRNPSANSDKLVIGDSKILIAGYDFVSNEVCLDYSLFLGLIITWVLIQVVLVVCCIILVRRYRRHYENESTTQSLEQLNKNFGIGFSNLENRRVRWADNGDYT